MSCHDTTYVSTLLLLLMRIRTTGVRPVSLAQLSNTYVTAVPVSDYRRCTTYAHAQLMARPA
jgi:hypothetical protein